MNNLNVILQLVRVPKSLIALVAGELGSSVGPAVPGQLPLVVEHQGTFRTLQLGLLVHHFDVALPVADLGEHLATVATRELFEGHLIQPMVYCPVLFEVNRLCGGKTTQVTYEVLASFSTLGTMRSFCVPFKILSHSEALHTKGTLVSFYGSSCFFCQLFWVPS